jgi:hypothetical protein
MLGYENGGNVQGESWWAVEAERCWRLALELGEDGLGWTKVAHAARVQADKAEAAAAEARAAAGPGMTDPDAIAAALLQAIPEIVRVDPALGRQIRDTLVKALPH